MDNVAREPPAVLEFYGPIDDVMTMRRDYLQYGCAVGCTCGQVFVPGSLSQEHQSIIDHMKDPGTMKFEGVVRINGIETAVKAILRDNGPEDSHSPCIWRIPPYLRRLCGFTAIPNSGFEAQCIPIVVDVGRIEAAGGVVEQKTVEIDVPKKAGCVIKNIIKWFTGLTGGDTLTLVVSKEGRLDVPGVTDITAYQKFAKPLKYLRRRFSKEAPRTMTIVIGEPSLVRTYPGATKFVTCFAGGNKAQFWMGPCGPGEVSSSTACTTFTAAISDHISHVIIFVEENKVSSKPNMATDCKKTLDVLRSTKIPLSSSRRNVLPDGRTSVRSVLLGAYSQGARKGITAATRQWPRLTSVLTGLARSYFPDFEFNAITVNSGYASKPHVDRRNVGPSLILALGNFSGGRLWVADPKGKSQILLSESIPRYSCGYHCGTYHNIQNQFLHFSGKALHCVEAFKGERFSVIWFNTPGVGRWDNRIKGDLQNLGFNIGKVNFCEVPQLAVEQSIQSLTTDKGAGIQPYAREPSFGHSSMREGIDQGIQAPAGQVSAAFLSRNRAVEKMLFASQFNRCIVEVCAHHDSILGQPSAASSGCLVLWLTEDENILTEGGLATAISWIRGACKHFGSARTMAWFSLTCTGGSPRQYMNLAKAKRIGDEAAVERVHAQHAKGMKLFDAAAVIVEATARAAPGLAWEWPKRCSYWHVPRVSAFHQRFAWYSCEVHGCMVGLRSINRAEYGELMQKAWTIKSNREHFCVVLGIKCDRSHSHVHVHGGRNTKMTERYTPDFAKRVHDAFSAFLSHHQ